MNKKMVLKFMSLLLLLEAFFMLPAMATGFIYKERNALIALSISAGICLLAGAALFIPLRKYNAPVYAREGFVVAGLGWFLLSFLGGLPFYISGEIPSLLDSFFESVSGFTTTGATILRDVEALSRCLLFWRSLSHWIGGVGVLAFVLLIVRSGGSGFAINLLRAEMPGPSVGKTLPKIRSTMQITFITYIVLSALNLAFLLAGRIPVFDALCIMFGTAGTGGFSLYNSGLAAYSPYIQNVCTVFMALFGVNFSLYFLLVRKDWKTVVKDEELHFYLITILSSTGFIAASLYFSGFGSFGASLHHSAFNVSSIITTTGYGTTNLDAWPAFSRAVLIILMIFGSMAGSTGGGFKNIRIVLLFKNMKAGIYKLLHPRSVKSVKVNKKTVDDAVVRGVTLFLSVYCGILVFSFLIVSLDNMPIEPSLTAVISCFNNIGPVFGMAQSPNCFADFSRLSKVVLSINMLLGRLEIFPILILFLPSTWKKKN